ncbi:uncharacterized protein A1O9_00207 [Exophiala aquamarina CBS 119918]|uniref:Tryptophan synthase beta chain-like PALP domain-containing protein n=1 Tax=Exophiala aquamarina CBS 119918 TaxID=1182545 RepID=A0A072Q2W2_9EURO|nr:uncharacterized protein A1O9_00207 [Exophiala aquamarina CBS 119918]KEF62235.1 hypothetical protein A1O9_00207 [Exophiala aquamarina CBS 119918]
MSKIYINPSARTWSHSYKDSVTQAQEFHRRLPGYQESPLVHLPDTATALRVKAVFVKDESSRLGLPAFKILGASWGTFRAIASQTGLTLDTDLDEISKAATKSGIVLFAATEGNHGRAVARMGKILSIPVKIFMSKFADADTVGKIESEGAHVTVITGDYDEAVARASNESKATTNGLLIQDNAFENYEEIPAWIVEGYLTLLFETEHQLAAQGLKATVLVTPVGVGSLGHAVVAYAKSDGRNIAVLTVEPETAACLNDNLWSGKWETIETSATIMNGMNCGTVSPISWPILRNGVDASVTISDLVCHDAINYLQSRGLNPGPCGAASLCALNKLAASDSSSKLLDANTVVVLLSTEGARGYETPAGFHGA